MKKTGVLISIAAAAAFVLPSQTRGARGNVPVKAPNATGVRRKQVL